MRRRAERYLGLAVFGLLVLIAILVHVLRTMLAYGPHGSPSQGVGFQFRVFQNQRATWKMMVATVTPPIRTNVLWIIWLAVL